MSIRFYINFLFLLPFYFLVKKVSPSLSMSSFVSNFNSLKGAFLCLEGGGVGKRLTLSHHKCRIRQEERSTVGVGVVSKDVSVLPTFETYLVLRFYRDRISVPFWWDTLSEIFLSLTYGNNKHFIGYPLPNIDSTTTLVGQRVRSVILRSNITLDEWYPINTKTIDYFCH